MALRNEYETQKTLNLQGGKVALKAVPQNQARDNLRNEYDAWCIHQRLPLVDAKEQLCGPRTAEQRQWLNAFCKRWEAL